MLADDVVKQCGTGSGKSGKVQIVQGELTAAASVDQIGGIMDVFNKDQRSRSSPTRPRTGMPIPRSTSPRR